MDESFPRSTDRTERLSKVLNFVNSDTFYTMLKTAHLIDTERGVGGEVAELKNLITSRLTYSQDRERVITEIENILTKIVNETG
ncbi:MAG: hypothetical protein MUF85_00655 [Patescibacteria group bacterium]|jgi:hypothetical protein|nr:hypothetical protein [Patescibacteria group bacterium]